MDRITCFGIMKHDTEMQTLLKQNAEISIVRGSIVRFPLVLVNETPAWESSLIHDRETEGILRERMKE